ncbi:MAG: stalk domain-containing protein [Candidatus Cryosericum sp.]
MSVKRRLLAAAIAVILCSTSLAGAIPARALGVTVPTVTVSPNVATVRAKYVIEFDLTAALQQYQSISIQFHGPSPTILPCTPCNQKIDLNYVRVNGVNPVQDVIGNSLVGSIQVRVPSALAAGAHVQLVFDEGARIGNPTVVGTYWAEVWTESDPLHVQSLTYLIGESQLETPVVTPDNDVAGASTAYFIALVTGGRGELTEDKDSVILTFPSAMALPAIPIASQVTVNGVQAAVVTRVQGLNTLSVRMPVSVGSRTGVTIGFLSKFGLANPSQRGEYRLLVRTTAEPIDVKSEPFAIVDRAAVTVTLSAQPETPDGRSGWYVHAPTVALRGESNVAGAVTIMYGIDATPAINYAGPIAIPDGVHTLRYVASNAQAGIVGEEHSVAYKVAQAGPALAVSGESTLLVSDPSYEIKGRVQARPAPVSGVDVQGKETHILADGTFSERLTLLEGKNDIEVVARDEAGQASFVQQTIVLDTVPPALTVTAPRLWEEVLSESVMVQGRVELGCTLDVAGRRIADVGSDGSFAVPVTLTPGKNTVLVNAQDRAGNVRQLAVIVISKATRTHEIVLTVDTTSMSVDGVSQPVDPGRSTTPVIVRGRTMVPISSIMSAVGGGAAWDAATRTVTLTLGMDTVVLTIGKATATVNGTAVRIDLLDAKVVPIIQNGRTMLPLRFAGESFGASVTWDSASRRITLVFPAS